MEYTQLNQIRDWLGQNKAEVAYFSNFESIQYLTGFGSDPIERILALFVFPEAEPFIFCPALEVEVVKATGWPYGVYGYQDHEQPFAMIAEHIKERITNPISWAIEKQTLTVERFEANHAFFPNAQFNLDMTPYMQAIRLIKTPAEIALLHKAGLDADFAMEVGFKAVAEGKTELQVAAELEYQSKLRGVSGMSFDTLVQAGAHAADPHGATSEIQMHRNELVLFDLGTLYQGYISDTSRTFAFGKPNAKALEVHNVVLEAQLTAQAAVKPGITAAQLDKIARDVITKAGYGEYFIHRLGHGMGTSEHEYPSIMEGNDLELQPGMTFSIEPGIYIPGEVGVRIEDCVVVTENGADAFTHSPKELRYID
ncbi:aminopeptidase P family protein [Periweissella fabaria]|uniref:Xaa-Pro dipeptidase n=1 Tax=Periweissella fabaria TaxID=546157 RepID=A0ABN8BD57_9LACO|nr:Xaa-Pro peptidase family protein [Periweissella fabaria]MCM0596518.1 aminopeptidase P family protein [Periweissella fabaria]CAH0415753.1 Xaa-Pro dipeptidase [Periweissella fabaria]